MSSGKRCGRFAPTPSGPLHFGSILAAVASYLDARSAKASWLVRIEDNDKPRTVKGAADDILRCLNDFGFEWDGEVVFQSKRDEIYRHYLEKLRENGHVFPCSCSRKDIAMLSGSEAGNIVYPGTCRAHPRDPQQIRSLRFRAADEDVVFGDRIQGEYRQNVEKDVGDFIVWRNDGCFAYHLCVVVDDELQGVTDVVRGADLIDSTPRQILIQRSLGFASLTYGHIPVAANAAGEKLSKQTLAQPVHKARAVELWYAALHFLGQNAPRELRQSDLKTIVAWGIENWNIDNVPKKTSIVLKG